MKKLFFLLVMLLPLSAWAQEIIIKSFSEAPATSLGKTIGDIPQTNEGEDAAVVIVKADRSDLSFEGRILTDDYYQGPTYEHGEYTLYVAPRSKSITVKIPGFPDARVSVADYPNSIPEGLQSRRMYVMYVQVVDKGAVAGRNISFGISGGYLMPTLNVSADNFTGSPINYGVGNTMENASYTDPKGFVVGANVDIRLHKFIYLNVGLDFGQYAYKNAFSGDVDVRSMMTNKDKAIPAHANFKESYQHMYLEVPVLASYRFSFGKRQNVQVGLGPVVNIGVKANCKFVGSTLLMTPDTWTSDNLGCMKAFDFSGDLDMYSDKTTVDQTIYYEKGTDKYSPNLNFDAPALKRLNVMAGAYVAYEISGIQLSVHYRYMLTNMANSHYWDNVRLPIMKHTTGAMPGTSIRHSYLQFKIGYTLRY